MVNIKSDDLHAEALTNAGTICRRNALGSRMCHDTTASELCGHSRGLWGANTCTTTPVDTFGTSPFLGSLACSILVST